MEAKDKAFSRKKTLLIQGKLMDLTLPKIMGILNVTPDSFYDGGKHHLLENAIRKAESMLEAGADMIDVGGYSTRPNASEVGVEVELSRVLPVIEYLAKNIPEVVISIDSFRAEVAKASIEAGASIVNDVSGGNLDADMFKKVSALKVPYILMHMRGTPATMRKLTDYDHLIKDIVVELSGKIQQLRDFAVNDIIIDPGFGFAKTVHQNYELLKNLSYFEQLDCPILVGISRKSMIHKLLNIDVTESLNGTTALNMASLINGANILRVHDVNEAAQTVKLFNQLQA